MWYADEIRTFTANRHTVAVFSLNGAIALDIITDIIASITVTVMSCYRYCMYLLLFVISLPGCYCHTIIS